MSGGLVLSGTGNGAQTFPSFPTVTDLSTGRAFSIPSPPAASFNVYRYGLLQWWIVAIAGYVHPDPLSPTGFSPNNPLVLPPNPPSLPSKYCSANSAPVRLGQQILIQDGANNQIEQWQVINVALFNGGPVQPMWRGFALPNTGPVAPLQIVASNFNAGESWQFVIPGFIQGG